MKWKWFWINKSRPIDFLLLKVSSPVKSVDKVFNMVGFLFLPFLYLSTTLWYLAAGLPTHPHTESRVFNMYLPGRSHNEKLYITRSLGALRAGLNWSFVPFGRSGRLACVYVRWGKKTLWTNQPMNGQGVSRSRIYFKNTVSENPFWKNAVWKFVRIFLITSFHFSIWQLATL